MDFLWGVERNRCFEMGFGVGGEGWERSSASADLQLSKIIPVEATNDNQSWSRHRRVAPVQWCARKTRNAPLDRHQRPEQVSMIVGCGGSV